MVNLALIEELDDLIAWHKMAVDREEIRNPMAVVIVNKLVVMVNKYRPKGMVGD